MNASARRLTPSPGPPGEGAPWITLALVACASLIHASTSVQSALQFDRHAVASGEFWRIVTGHFTHWSVNHLLWDLAVFVALGTVCERLGRARMIWTIASSILMISFFAAPRLPTYRGLSGIDSALFVLLAVTLRRERPLVVSLLLAAFAFKSCYELATGHTFFVDNAASGFVPVPLAHIIGGICGAIVGLLPFAQSRPPITIART
ncbi:MAG: rhombosortase [Anaerolineae bacterium]|nr:rhombosortase [Phycisphaerae bacterium]